MFTREETEEFVNQFWENDILTPPLAESALGRYITIPCVSPNYYEEGENWYDEPHMADALKHVEDSVRSQGFEQIHVEMLHPNEKEGGYRTPFLLVEIGEKDSSNESVLIYGHLDKQPGMEGSWKEGEGPWIPTRQGDKLYGRGSADDGY